MESQTIENKKWYEKTWLVILLCIFFFPVGLYALWKNSSISQGWKIGVTVFFATIVLIQLTKEEKSNSTNSNNSAATNAREVIEAEEPKINYPVEQTKFIAAIKNGWEIYKEQPNELKKSVVRSKRGIEIKNVLQNSLEISNWIGIIDNMETNSEGKAILKIKLEETDISIQTWNNSLSDIFDNTLIPQESNLFTVLAEMKKGDRVLFSGTFLPSDKNDFVKEESLTEEGSMTEPEFIFRFSGVKIF